MSHRKSLKYPDAGKYVIPKNLPKYIPAFFDWAKLKMRKSFESIKDMLHSYWEEYQKTGKPRKPRKMNGGGLDNKSKTSHSEMEGGGYGTDPAVQAQKQLQLIDSTYQMTRQAMADAGVLTHSDIVRGLDIIYNVAKDNLVSSSSP